MTCEACGLNYELGRTDGEYVARKDGYAKGWEEHGKIDHCANCYANVDVHGLHTIAHELASCVRGMMKDGENPNRRTAVQVMYDSALDRLKAIEAHGYLGDKAGSADKAKTATVSVSESGKCVCPRFGTECEHGECTGPHADRRSAQGGRHEYRTYTT